MIKINKSKLYKSYIAIMLTLIVVMLAGTLGAAFYVGVHVKRAANQTTTKIDNVNSQINNISKDLNGINTLNNDLQNINKSINNLNTKLSQNSVGTSLLNDL